MVFLLLTQSFPAEGWSGVGGSVPGGASGPPHRGACYKMMAPGPLPLSALGSWRWRVPIIL